MRPRAPGIELTAATIATTAASTVRRRAPTRPTWEIAGAAGAAAVRWGTVTRPPRVKRITATTTATTVWGRTGTRPPKGIGVTGAAKATGTGTAS